MATEIVKIIDPDNGTGTDYTSLSAWEAAMQKDLTAADEISVAKCRCTGGTADTAITLIDGWTTDATRYIKVWTDPNEGYRHNGTYQTGNKYRLEISSTATNYAFSSKEGYAEIIGLQIQIKSETSNQHCILADNGNAVIKIDKCIFKSYPPELTSYYHRGIGTSTGNSISGTYKISNSIFIDFRGNSGAVGIDVDENNYLFYIYNCTFVNCLAALSNTSRSVSSITAKNCLFRSNTDDLPLYTARDSVDYCATDRSSLKNGTGNRLSQTFSFVDEANDDFHLAPKDLGALAYGVNLYNDANLAFQDDIDGRDRGGSGHIWSIGATAGYEERTCVVDPDNGAGTDYTSLSAWEAARQGNLTTRLVPEVAKCRCTGGTADTTAVSINGWTTDAARYIKILTDPNENYRHSGEYDNTKYRLEVVPPSGKGIINNDGIGTYIRIDGLQFKFTHPNDATRRSCFSTDYGGYFKLSNLVCDVTINSAGGDSQGALIQVGPWAGGSADIWNVVGKASQKCLYYACVEEYFNSSSAVNIYNCTFKNFSTGIKQGVGTVRVKNCGFVDVDGHAGTISETTNSYSTPIFGFGKEFHLGSADTAWKGQGTNLSADSYLSFNDDIDGEARGATWDIGADQYVSIIPIGATCWGHQTGVTQQNIRTFQGNWTGTGSVENTGDSERIKLEPGQYMISEVVETGAVTVTLGKDVY